MEYETSHNTVRANAQEGITVVNRKTILRIVFAMLLAVILLLFYRPVIFGSLLMFGRSRVCSWSEAWHSFQEKHSRQAELDSFFESTLRLVRSDEAGFELYAIPQSEIWVPPGNRMMLLWLLTEINRQAYLSDDCHVQQGDIVLDCGAHVGLFTRQALAAGAKLVVAIEPARENLECLRRNLAEEIEEGRVIIYPKGVWDRDDTLMLKTRPGFSASDSVVISGNEDFRDTYKVPLTTIDALFAELNLDRIDFIKMNIEGAEQRALAGSSLILSQFKPRMAIAANHHDDDISRIPELVRSARSDYFMACGACYVDHDRLMVLPEILFFY